MTVVRFTHPTECRVSPVVPPLDKRAGVSILRSVIGTACYQSIGGGMPARSRRGERKHRSGLVSASIITATRTHHFFVASKIHKRGESIKSVSITVARWHRVSCQLRHARVSPLAATEPKSLQIINK